MSDEGLQWFYTSFTSLWEVPCLHLPLHLHRPLCGTSCISPLVALPVPPRYTFPNSSLDSCLAQTSNVVHASLAVPLLKNLHLRHNQTAAARSQVGPNHGILIRHSLGKQDLLEPCQPFLCGHLWGGSWTRLR